MGEIEVGKTILLDTNCFIYYFEDNPKYADKLEKVLQIFKMERIKLSCQ